MNFPSCAFLIATFIVNAVLAFRVSRFLGETYLEEGMFWALAITPIGIGLHEPLLICWPLVIVWPLQKLMKLLLEVNEAAVPAVALFRPSLWEPLEITLESKP